MAIDATFSARLRTGTSAEIAGTLAEALTTTDAATLTSHLLSAVETSSIPPVAFSIFITLSKDPHVLAAGLKQAFSFSIRRSAIKRLGAVLRQGDGFQPIWAALGGASGLAGVMKELSVSEIDYLCRTLGTSGFRKASANREKALSESLGQLFRLDPEETEQNAPSRDARPLRHFYARLLPACTVETREQWRRATEPSAEGPKPYYPHYLEPGQEEVYHASIVIGPGTCKLEGFDWLKSLDGLQEDHVSTLARLAECDVKDLRIKPIFFYSNLILPMPRRMAKRKYPAGVRSKLWSFLLSCFKRWPSLADFIRSEKYGLLRLAVRRWIFAPADERRENAGLVLRSLFELLPASHIPSLSSSLLQGRSGLLQGTRSQRYDLLRLLVGLPGKYGIDIDSPSDADKAKLNKVLEETIPYTLFLSLPGDKAAALLDLIAEIRPDKAFIQLKALDPSDPFLTIAHQSAEPNSEHGDFQILHCLLHTIQPPSDPARLGSDILRDVGSHVKVRIDKANRAREWGDRLLWAKSALLLCIGASSLPLFSDTLRWARRFDKDPFVINGLYRSDVILRREGAVLMCGIPTKARLPAVSVDGVRDDIATGNEIILQLLSAASAAAQEPHFNRYHWADVRQIFSHVVKHRLRLVNAFQSYHGLTDDEVYGWIWEPTLHMLIEAERFTLQEEHEMLEFVNRNGLLEDLTLTNLRDHTWEFLDNLARARDELWKQERVKRIPAVLDLQAPWPKGLGVQHLCDFKFEPEETTLQLPYLESRAKATLFADPEVLLRELPTDQETLDAIGCISDYYKACFNLYVNSGKNRPDRVAEVWRYAMDHLSRGMSREEARNFWQRDNLIGELSKWTPPPEPLEARKLPAPVFPDSSSDPSSPAEWYPGPRPVALTVHRTMEGDITCLDHITECHYDWVTAITGHTERPPHRELSVRGTPAIWETDQYEQPFSGETQDVYIAAAALFLNTKAGSDSSLLMKPFPSSPADTRFPAVYLSDEFLEQLRSTRSEPDWYECVGILERYRSRVPPLLLKQLASSMLQRLHSDATSIGYHRQVTMRTINLLSRSDRPSAAYELIHAVVIDGQGDSSWHRHLFNRGFFDLLLAREAKGILESLSDALIKRLEEQAKKKAQTSEPQPDGEARQTPIVKVSTVKMLAQIMNDSYFIDKSTAVSILCNILSKSNHPDIKMAALESLLQIFTASTDNDSIRATIMQSLVAHAVPMASSFDERRLLTEKDWEEAEAQRELPEIQAGGFWDRPLLQTLLNTGLDHKSFTPEWRRSWTEQILIPILEKSVENNARWFAMFLRINAIQHKRGDLPPVPVDPALYSSLLERRPEFVTAKVFNMMARLTMNKILPLPEIVAINSKVKADRALAKSAAGQHWLNIFGSGREAWGWGIDKSIALLNSPASLWEKFSGDNGITIPLVQNLALSIANTWIDRANVDEIGILVGRLNEIPRSHGYRRKECWLAWRTNSLPILQRIIQRIDSLRTPAWNCDPHRRPRRLPDTFKIRLHTLTFPSTFFQEKAPASDITTFADEIVSIIRELAEPGTPLGRDWESLRSDIIRPPVSGSDLLRIALALAQGISDRFSDEARRLTPEEYMRLSLAQHLIRKADDPNDMEVVKQVREMIVVEWSRSFSEEVREEGRVLLKEIKGQVKNGKGFWKKYVAQWEKEEEEAKERAKTTGMEVEVDGTEWLGENETEGDEASGGEPGLTPAGGWGDEWNVSS